MTKLKVRVKKEAAPTACPVLESTEQKVKKKKYPVNVVFDGDLEAAIRQRAKETGVGVATYIKILVSKDLNNG